MSSGPLRFGGAFFTTWPAPAAAGSFGGDATCLAGAFFGVAFLAGAFFATGFAAVAAFFAVAFLAGAGFVVAAFLTGAAAFRVVAFVATTFFAGALVALLAALVVAAMVSCRPLECPPSPQRVRHCRHPPRGRQPADARPEDARAVAAHP